MSSASTKNNPFSQQPLAELVSVFICENRLFAGLGSAVLVGSRIESGRPGSEAFRNRLVDVQSNRRCAQSKRSRCQRRCGALLPLWRRRRPLPAGIRLLPARCCIFVPEARRSARYRDSRPLLSLPDSSEDKSRRKRVACSPLGGRVGFAPRARLAVMPDGEPPVGWPRRFADQGS